MTDEVKFTYEDWGMLSQRQQDNNSAIGSDDYDVKYTYAKSTSGRNTIQRSTLKYARAGTDLATITYEYSSSGGLFDADASRVTDIKLSTTKIAEYNYNGVGSLVGTNLPEPDMYSYRYDPTTSGSYPDLDRFNRPTTDDWTKNLATDRDTYSVTLTYDRNSNITRLEDNIFTTGRDVQYTIDNINRLTKAEEGDWNGSSIINRSRQQIWTLDQLGNQTRVKLDLNGDNDFVDSGESDDTRTHNNPNELTAQDTDSNSSNNYTLTYNKLGQMTDNNRYDKLKYDGFGRLVKINNQSSSLVEQFWYDGLGERISWKYDTNSDGRVDGSDKKYHFAYDERWRLAMVFRESDTSPKEEHFYHAAGLDGMGGSSYIDSEVLRDKDDNSGWTSAADGTLEQRYYYNQNWRADTVALVTSTGVQVEGDRHSSYGNPFGMYAGDVNGDGVVDATDTTQIQTWITGVTYDSRGDLDRDGDVDATDKSSATTNIGTNLGRGKLSATSVANRKGYAGYAFDPITSYAMFDVRHRELNADLGRWITRDPIGYAEGSNLYSLVTDNPLHWHDPSGMACNGCASSSQNSSPSTTNPLHLPATLPPIQVSTSTCVYPLPPAVTGPPFDRDDAFCAALCSQQNPDFPGLPLGAAACRYTLPPNVPGPVYHICCNCVYYNAPKSQWNCPFMQPLAACIDLCEPMHFPNLDCHNNGQWAGLGQWTSECIVNRCVRDCFAQHACAPDALMPGLCEDRCRATKRQLDANVAYWCKEKKLVPSSINFP